MLLDYFHKFPQIETQRMLRAKHKLNLLVLLKSTSCFKVLWG